jgi:GTPase SAR1 family protein
MTTTSNNNLSVELDSTFFDTFKLNGVQMKNIGVMGDGGVGKTCLFSWEQRYIATDPKKEKLLPKCKVTEYGGQYKYGIEFDYSHHDLIVIVYSATSRVTYRNIPYWYKRAKKLSNADTKFLLVKTNVNSRDARPDMHLSDFKQFDYVMSHCSKMEKRYY